MSKFKLDFDISKPVHRLAKRVPCPPVPSSPPPPVSVPAVDKDDVNDDKQRAAPKGLRIPKRYVYAAFAGSLLLYFALHISQPPPATQLRRRNMCRYNHATPIPPLVVCQNHCQSDVCVAQFDTVACADRVQTAHYHYPDGHTQLVPALYERVPNTSMFFVRGNSAVFQPAYCQAKTQAVVVHEPDASQQLHAHLVWTAPPTTTRFRLVRADTGKTLAELDAHFVQDRCNADHCVYKLETHCPRPFATHVLSVDTDTPAPTFLFCE
jgi:hypothetical protein